MFGGHIILGALATLFTMSAAYGTYQEVTGYGGHFRPQGSAIFKCAILTIVLALVAGDAIFNNGAVIHQIIPVA